MTPLVGEKPKLPKYNYVANMLGALIFSAVIYVALTLANAPVWACIGFAFVVYLMCINTATTQYNSVLLALIYRRSN